MPCERKPVPPQCLDRSEQKVDGLAPLVDGAVEVVPLSPYADVCLVNPPGPIGSTVSRTPARTGSGRTFVPLAMYWKDGRAKLEVGLARDKKDHDRRADTKDREGQREKARGMKGRQLGARTDY
jgi:hypothetical protein